MATTTEGDVDETICTFERVADLGEVAQLPIATAASIVDAIIFAAAICDVRRGKAFGYWGRI